ncbi:bifunctional diaminohydroxyphosphoribosylaminopyrimidine deaminase/5-amino-6-(5-phosphoribosylamino)uracil reductase RibD [Pseudomonas parafulva]|uniref:bifunctional diaminohydroxyphosphoribosylaminopyrimidine deaminase/5-amino-6-(5-phosphoribosylamino)uracil reductase RibD n=1 Tax=Pseudomonas parafulva TaxID=157782 RepID=UPI0005407708|nr:bifunctional diaminohydroxyphosphoribosylaminopyrimidine deaminase/5-amino-6-(5-phosphoribosylamino)uracil reductase RibD [Pseudomonas parafulva]AIZ32112.1 riboflavin biosynthesis protein RibD [Pseudomonas parafulva]
MTEHADHRYMQQALDLARRGSFTTRPNPMVGCVIVKDDGVVGEGWHVRAGQAHAEVHALRHAGAKAQGATAYVTLEPCAHHGRTPPCYQALIGAGVARVVVACEDPFHKVAGRGIAGLREAGIDVHVGVLRSQAQALNKGFISSARRGRPWVTLKLGMSLDGRTALADGQSQWITGAAARADVHRLRREHCAILTGIGTVLADDPALTVRLDDPQAFVPPWRVVLDSALRTPHTAQLVDGAVPTFILHGVTGGQAPRGAEGIQVASQGGRLDLLDCLTALNDRGVHSVLVEAGATLAGALIQEGLVDDLVLYVAPKLLGSAARPLLVGDFASSLTAPAGLRLVTAEAVGEDVKINWRSLRSESECFAP